MRVRLRAAAHTAIARCLAPALSAVALAGAGCGGATQIDMGSDPDFLWWTNHESGNLSDWSQGGPLYGRIWPSSPAQVIVASTDHARSGRYSMQATVTTGGFSGGPPGSPLLPPPVWWALAVRSGNLPAQGYYSAWYYIPSMAVPVGPNGFWLFSKFRSRDPSTPMIPVQELWDFDLTYLGATKVLVVDLFRHNWPVNQYPRLPAPPPVPTGKWFQIESFYKPATDNTGVLKVWQDGVLIYDIENEPTAPSTYVEWTVGNMSDGLMPSTASIYIDDAAITRRQLGPSFPPFSGGN
jgi:hypothetical protein